MARSLVRMGAKAAIDKPRKGLKTRVLGAYRGRGAAVACRMRFEKKLEEDAAHI